MKIVRKITPSESGRSLDDVEVEDCVTGEKQAKQFSPPRQGANCSTLESVAQPVLAFGCSVLRFLLFPAFGTAVYNL